MLYFLRWQFTDDGRLIHSLEKEPIDFESHLWLTGAIFDPHAEWCKCPYCKPELYKLEG